jgi:pimeloyl-ACP methyl ester carboxylesterase
MIISTIDGISAETVTTDRLTTRVLFSGSGEGIPVLFLHGNMSSATWWEEIMVSLPAGFRGIAPDQRGFGEADIEKKIDARRGMGDLVDDAIALLDKLGIERVHVIGHSWGAMIIWRIIADHVDRLLSVTMVSPASPYGFGGTKDVDGLPCTEDFAGSGGGLSNPEMITRIVKGDRSLDSPFSSRAVIRSLIVKPPFVPPREEELLSSMLMTHIGDRDVPGDTVRTSNWPYVSPGVWGAANATSPKYIGDIGRVIEATPKAPILWIRGSHDLIVSDTAASDPGYLGKMGFIPGCPGEEKFPPQPMLAQTRAFLDKYADADGEYEEVVIENTGHASFVENPQEFNRIFHVHLTRS